MSRIIALVSIILCLTTAAIVTAREDGIAGNWATSNLSELKLEEKNPWCKLLSDCGPRILILNAPPDPVIALTLKLNPPNNVTGNLSFIAKDTKKLKVEEGSFTNGVLTFKTREKEDKIIVEST